MKLRYMIVPLMILALWGIVGLFVTLAVLYSGMYLLASVFMGLLTVMLAITV